MVNDFIRPSAIAAFELCPGRPTMEGRICQAIPGWQDKTSAIAEQGTMAHAVIAQALALMYHSPVCLAQDQALVHLAGALERLEPWSRDAARRSVAYAASLVDIWRSKGYQVTVQIEMHLSGKGIGINRGGTADLVLLCATKHHLAVLVVDWKTGFLDQGEACEHRQLGAYAVMAADKHQPDHMEVHLAQARRKEFSAGYFDDQAVADIRSAVLAAVSAAQEEKPPLRPSIDACRYCKALPLCAAARNHIMHAAERHALLGTDPTDRAKLAEDAALARRFAEEARELAKLWREAELERCRISGRAPF
jgi:hypothetical protein